MGAWYEAGGSDHSSHIKYVLDGSGVRDAQGRPNTYLQSGSEGTRWWSGDGDRGHTEPDVSGTATADRHHTCFQTHVSFKDNAHAYGRLRTNYYHPCKSMPLTLGLERIRINGIASVSHHI